MPVSHNLLKCEKCKTKIDFFVIIKWLNSGIDQLRCKKCNNILLNEFFILADYFFVGLYGAILINEIDMLNKWFMLKDWALVLIIIVSSLFLLILLPLLFLGVLKIFYLIKKQST